MVFNYLCPVTKNELMRRFPSASAAFIRANSDPLTVDPLSGAVVECGVQKQPLVASQGKEKSPSGPFYRVTITSWRTRLTDPDNLCPKFLIDAMRYENLIPDDSPAHIVLQVQQIKVPHRGQEGTLVTITAI